MASKATNIQFVIIMAIHQWQSMQRDIRQLRVGKTLLVSGKSERDVLRLVAENQRHQVILRFSPLLPGFVHEDTQIIRIQLYSIAVG